MEIKETHIKNVDLSQFGSNIQNFIVILKKSFNKITLSINDNLVEVFAYYQSGQYVVFEIGEENVYLKDTPFYAKDSQEQLVAIVHQLYFLD
jgi:hypothetical protein